jgi:hypothetical protein
LETFFATTDVRVNRCDYSVLAFYTLAQHLNLMDKREQTDRRTLANLDAVARATGRARR